ncbi:metallophosphoesterase [Bellilinea sp.]|jgi:predicted MPP superfamily phosphohydrolase|uniref:metallophosphoesterase n=1 Tax=Bellilinea sp. TaxID=2838785 RepID=UPI002ADD8CDD|nr:metallophosphoesterase [Bellilinea sp.]
MIEARDFSARRNFPGEVGNDFDVVLRRYDAIQKIHPLFFGLILFGLAWLPTRMEWEFTLALWGFFMLDWLMLALLPVFHRSFGPPQPPAFLLALMRLPFALLPYPVNFLLQTIGSLLVFYGFWIEPHRLTLAHQILQTPKLKSGSRLRVLHLGDLHVERITRREKKMQEWIKQLRPDLILFSGDILNLSYNRDPIALEHARQLMAEWQAPLGVYAVAGSPAVDLAEILPGFYNQLPVQYLAEEQIELNVDQQKIHLIGLSCTHRPFIDAPRLEKLLPKNNQNFTILLYHTPDLAPNAAKTAVDLQLSGHTHGGQVRLPLIGALFTASLYGRAFSSGRYQLNGLTLYITRGIGMEGAGAPRVRFLCPPEITLWEIQGSGEG